MIERPEYVGRPMPTPYLGPEVKDDETIAAMRVAGRIAAQALQEVGRHIEPGVTTDRLDAIGRERRAGRGPQDPPHGLHRGVLIGGRGGQELERDLAAIVGASDYVGERAAAIDPEGETPVQNLTSRCDCHGIATDVRLALAK